MNAATSTTSNPALKLQEILVPVDFSEASYKALRYAAAFANQFNARITILHVVHVTYMAGEYGPIDVPVLEAQLLEAARKKLASVGQEQVPPGCLHETIVRNGPAAHEIATVAQEKNSDLIIISTHGYTGLKRVMLGSVAENVVRHAPCPVLVVREREHEFISE